MHAVTKHVMLPGLHWFQSYEILGLARAHVPLSSFYHSWVGKSFNLAKRWAEVIGHAALGNPNAVVEHVCSQSWEHISPTNLTEDKSEYKSGLHTWACIRSYVHRSEANLPFKRTRERLPVQCLTINKVSKHRNQVEISRPTLGP